jgi:hypothetical protein
MRLKTSRAGADERLLLLLNAGYELRQILWKDYSQHGDAGSFNPDIDNKRYAAMADAWANEVLRELNAIFPSQVEANAFADRWSASAVDYSNVDQKFGYLFYSTLPTLMERLRRILEVSLPRYTDLPIHERLFIEDIDSFRKVRDVNPAMVAHALHDGRLERSEDEIQRALERILDVPVHKKDWGGELNDLYSANIIVNGARAETAFLLKGNGLRKPEMQIADCGKNGDQLVRLFQSPARLFVVQFVGSISEMVVADVLGKVQQRRVGGTECNFLIMDGQDTARVLHAYGQL